MLEWLINKFLCEPVEKEIFNGKTLQEVYGYDQLPTVEELYNHRRQVCIDQYEKYKAGLEETNND